jgi:hypothetical protein
MTEGMGSVKYLLDAFMIKQKRTETKQNLWQFVSKLFRRERRSSDSHAAQRGQVLVLFVISFLTLATFAGLVTDAGSLYVTYAQLKRAVDSAAVAAANNLKYSALSYTERQTRITEAAREMIDIHNIADISLMEVYTCDDTGLPAEFVDDCPGVGEEPRKLAWVQATQDAPVYFLRLVGIQDVPLTVRSIGEAATVDLVLVIDSSQSMASETPGYGSNYNPNVSCNPSDTCEPLQTAKDAAKVLVNNMFEGYDQIAIVNFDFESQIKINLTSTPYSSVIDAIDDIDAHDDTPIPIGLIPGMFNPFNVEMITPGDPPNPDPNKAVFSTCTGCGIREAGEILEAYGRRDSVWVIVFLSDGSTNVSDLPPNVDSIFPNGFCGGDIDERLWTNPMCRDELPDTRHCGPYHVDKGLDITNCPPGSTWAITSPPYDVEDYARDMIDQIALWDPDEAEDHIKANEVTIFSIGLGFAAVHPHYAGEEMLRYMANVGENGSREGDKCDGVDPKITCGNYYYTEDASNLAQIYEDIAGRIFSRISK